MKVGRLNLKLARPTLEALEQQLGASIGCSAAEVEAMLPRAAIASFIASALVPFVKDPPPIPALARAIAAAGIRQVRAEVHSLYLKVLRGKPKT